MDHSGFDSHGLVNLVTIQGVVMGIVVFGTYDGLLQLWERRQNRNSDGENELVSSGEASVLVHTGAGAAAGLTRSLVWVGWERWVHNMPHSSLFCLRTAIHRTVGFGSLFGSYQATRHFLSRNLLARSDTSEGLDDSILETALAGGFAGQVHHVVQHYTFHWRQFHPKLPPPPRWKPVVNSFGPMALCFLALEYGGGGAEDFLERIRLPWKDLGWGI